MSHEVKVHEAQTSILRELLFMPMAGFAELQKPTGLTSDHFTFHINRLVELKLVERTKRGQYRLTTTGKEYANRLDTDDHTIERQAKIAVLIVPTRMRDDNTREYMVQKRLKQPFYGRHGFMTGKLRWGETVVEGALRELDEETGLGGDLTIKGVYHKMDYATDGRMLEDKHFYVVRADNPTGTFKAAFEGGENYWYTIDEIMTLTDVFAGMDTVVEAVTQPNVVIWQTKFEYDLEEY
ncbi:MAG TPA: NUDIX domain-containing protein [Candidatus Saccharimonadia bacterium]|nr:NUDIX domain-containing protein [Candidatus Saccharimonadia bacterium]